jgi:2-polyprenyl-3-methyl-5-hydroxy-6-metoxy-1,4-benzoquinol methylase
LSGGVSAGDTRHRSAAQLARVAATLYAADSLLQRFRPYICPFEELLPIVPEGSRVLDVGCGGGLFLGLLSAEGRIRSGLGFDSSSSAISVAQRMCRRAAHGRAWVQLEFQCRDASAPWPEGIFDVVCLIDVLHHVTPQAQRPVFEAAATRLGAAGLLIYKDMASAPAWQAWANRLHDLVLARQWIHYVPVERVERWASEIGLVLVDARAIDRYCYRHDLRVFRRN